MKTVNWQRALVTTFLAGSTLLACNKEANRGSKVTTTETTTTTAPNGDVQVEKTTHTTTPSSEDRIKEQRAQYERETQAKLDRLSDRLDKVKDHASDSKSDKLSGFQKQLTDVKARLEAAKAELKVLKDADQPAWASTRTQLEKSIAEVETSLDQLQTRAGS